MFKATVLVCIIGQPCMEMSEKEIYTTVKACEVKVAEMKEQVRNTIKSMDMHPDAVAFLHRCEKQQGA